MSLAAVTSTALSGISTAQRALRATANNITNVNTEVYDRRVVLQQARLVGGLGAGVEIGTIRRVVDTFLASQLLSAESDASRYEVMSNMYERLEAVLGSPEDNTSVAGHLDRMFASLGALAIEPDSAVCRASIVSEIESWASEVTRLADKIQEWRKDADRQIDAALTDANFQIRQIHDLNSLITREENLGRDTATLEEQQEDALTKLSQYMDIGTFEMSHGFLGVTGARGMVLVDTGYRALEYNPVGAVSTQTRFSQILVKKVDLESGLAIGTGQAFDINRDSGQLDGLLTVRDVTLPNFALSLGELAGGVIDRLNAVHNNNVSVPPPGAFTGRNTGLLGTDALNFTGDMTFAALDSNNDYVGRVVVNFDAVPPTIDNGGGAGALAGSTIDDLVTGLNGANGFNGSATVTFSAGVLTITAAGSATGVATIQDTSRPSDRGGRGFSHFFGLNDLVEAIGETHFDTGMTGSDVNGFSSGTITMELRGPENQTAVSFSVTPTPTDDFDALIVQLDSGGAGFVTFALDSNGALVATPASGFEAYGVVVTSDTTVRGASAVSMSDFFGLGDRYTMDAARGVSVVEAIRLRRLGWPWRSLIPRPLPPAAWCPPSPLATAVAPLISTTYRSRPCRSWLPATWPRSLRRSRTTPAT